MNRAEAESIIDRVGEATYAAYDNPRNRRIAAEIDRAWRRSSGSDLHRLGVISESEARLFDAAMDELEHARNGRRKRVTKQPCPECLYEARTGKVPPVDHSCEADPEHYFRPGHEPNEDLAWREVYGRAYHEAEARGLEPWRAREEASREAWRDYEARTGQPALIRNARREKRHDLRFAGYEFTSGPSGTTVHRESLRTDAPGDYGADPLGDGTFRMVPSGDVVGLEERNRRLARFHRNPPLWEAEDQAEYMRLLDRYDAEMAEAMELEDEGYAAQAAIRRRAAEAAERSADRIAKRYEGNGSGYYVWALARGSDEPLTEGPWGPYDTIEGAKTFARIGATEGAHDRAVTLGVDPKASGFRILRRYEAGSGARLV